MRRASLLIALVAGLAAAVASAPGPDECSTLVAAGAATVDGSPLLWKNRDTDTLSNKVVLVEDTPHRYLGLVNAHDPAGRMVWAGLNSAGFAVANSVAYNLPLEAGEQIDLEGIIMADALRVCATVAEFEAFLSRRLNRDLGSRANFLAIDARGGAAIFETHNHGLERLNCEEAPDKYLANTNFSRSGAQDEGMGYLRFDREMALLAAAPGGKLSHDYLLQVVARDVGHSLLGHPGRDAWKKLPAGVPLWLHTNHAINRPSTASAVVIRGVNPGGDPSAATMWVILGEPVTSIAVPLWVAAGAPPAELWEGKDAAISVEASRLKDLLRPLPSRERREYIDVTRLDNAAGTGWLPATLEAEREILRRTGEFLRRRPTPAEMSRFENDAAASALRTLRQVPGK